jgi:hypothetical protein
MDLKIIFQISILYGSFDTNMAVYLQESFQGGPRPKIIFSFKYWLLLNLRFKDSKPNLGKTTTIPHIQRFYSMDLSWSLLRYPPEDKSFDGGNIRLTLIK